jgi:hypothetical protein
MLYQEKYTKYKNKYLDLKSKYGHLLNTTPQKTQLSNITHSKILLDLDESEHQKNLVNPKIINLTGGTNLTSLKFESDSESNQESETITTLNNLTSSESISSLFKQNGGTKGKKKPKKSKVNKGVNHFFQDKSTSDSSLSSDSSTLSEVQSDSDFSSSDLEW